MGRSMRETFETLHQPTLWDSSSATSSQGSESGATRSDKQDWKTTARSGPDPAHASLSARQASEKGLLTSGTYGPSGSGSLSSASLSASLANRLRPVTLSLGSTLYRLTWKVRVTPSGRMIYALRALARRTRGNAFTGWPTPDTQNHRDGNTTRVEMKGSHSMSLHHAAAMAGWPSPLVNNARGPQKGPNRQGGPCLQMAASLAATGGTPSGSNAQTEKCGQLNPAHSRWLMGLPPVFCDCAVMAMQSLQKSRKASSKRAWRSSDASD